VIEATAKIPGWLPSREGVALVAHHLGCMPDAAQLQIIGEGKDGWIKAWGLTVEGWPVSPLPVAWNGMIDLAGATMKLADVSYVITNLQLCFIDLVAAGLLPAPAEKARWPAAEAIAYLVKDLPLPWGAWQGAGASPAEIEQAEIDLGEAILAGVPAWGWHPLERRRKRISSDHFRAEMIERKEVLPVSVTRLLKVVARIDGAVGTSPLSRIAEYSGPRWEAIEVDSAALRQARPRPWTTQAELPATQSDESAIADPALAANAPAAEIVVLLPVEWQKTKPWITNEAVQMKRDGKIPAGIGISDLAREFERRMRDAAKTDRSVRPVGWKHIKNHLPEWGLWPVSKIKIPQ
jgi:hypothetical protein